MKCIFLTGGTGVLGSAIAPLFLADADTRLILLLRASSPKHLGERMERLYEFWETDGADSGEARRIEALRGDVCLPKFGLESEVYDRLTNEVTHVIHSAGDVKLNLPLEDARRSHVDSAKNVVELAQYCQRRGQFQKLEFISTVGIAGALPGLIEERAYVEPRRFHNTYEAVKAEAESHVWAEIGKGLPGTIHRPSMIVGDSQTGKAIRFQVFYHLADFLAGRRTWGIVPQTHGSKLDIIPVDFAARAVHFSCISDITAGRILHLTSGPDLSWTLNDVASRWRSLLQASGQRTPRLWKLPLDQARRVFNAIAAISYGRKRRFLQGLPFLLDYLEEQQSFDNSKTTELLSTAGIEVPQVDKYLDVVLQAYLTYQLERSRRANSSEWAVSKAIA